MNACPFLSFTVHPKQHNFNYRNSLPWQLFPQLSRFLRTLRSMHRPTHPPHLSKASFVRTRKIVYYSVDSEKLSRPIGDFGLQPSKLASAESSKLSKDLKNDKLESAATAEGHSALFDDIKHRFLHFKEHVYLENFELYEELANAQAPETPGFPPHILGFQPGEAFVVRNVANMVPLYESGPSEANAALEFAVNSLKVKHISVIGHSKCGGIRTLTSVRDDIKASFIGSWVAVGMKARLRTKAASASLNFDRLCRHCEKESVNCSSLNLLTYPWIEEKLKNGELSIHCSYYDLAECTFEKWTLDYKGSGLKKEGGKVALKNQAFWC